MQRGDAALQLPDRGQQLVCLRAVTLRLAQRRFGRGKHFSDSPAGFPGPAEPFLRLPYLPGVIQQQCLRGGKALSAPGKFQAHPVFLYGFFLLQHGAQRPFRPVKGLKVRVDCPALLQGGGQGLRLCGSLLPALVQRLTGGPFALCHACKAFRQQGGILFIRPVQRQLFRLGKALFRGNAPGGQAQALSQLILFPGAGSVHVLKALLQRRVQGRVEQLLKQGLALVRGRVEDFQEVSLGNHHRPGELILRQPQQLINPGVDLRNALHHRACVQAGQHGPGGLGGGALTGHLGPDIFRIAPDAIPPAPVAEGQFHKGFRAGRCIVRAEGAAFAPFPAAGGLAVQGEADSVKQGGFARPGIPGNQENAVFPQG